MMIVSPFVFLNLDASSSDMVFRRERNDLSSGDRAKHVKIADGVDIPKKQLVGV